MLLDQLIEALAQRPMRTGELAEVIARTRAATAVKLSLLKSKGWVYKAGTDTQTGQAVWALTD